LSIRKITLVIAMTASAYLLLFGLNDYLFSFLGYSNGVTWIFLPSGLRLMFVLLFVEWGAVGIALASMTVSYLFQFEGNLLTLLGAGVISGFAPWLARRISIDKLDLDVNLKDLTAVTLIRISVLFAVLSAVLHQFWYTWRGQTESFVKSTAVMAIGDLAGTIVVLYAVKSIMTLLVSRVTEATPGTMSK